MGSHTKRWMKPIHRRPAQCRAVRKSNRWHRGLYDCHACGTVRNADVNGALNMLKKGNS